MDTAKALAAGALFDFEGVTYTVPPVVFAIQAEFEKYFVAQAYANLRRDQRILGAEYESERTSLRRDIDAGLYNFESDLVKDALRNTRHLKHMLYLCLAYGNKDRKIEKDLIERIDKAGRSNDLMEAVNQANSDPNPTPSPNDTK